MNQVFGNFIEQEADKGEYLKIGFQPSSVPLQVRWRNNGLSANFVAGYLSTFFPGEDPASTTRQSEIKDAVSFIANELLENAMKFSHPQSHLSVTLEMFLDVDVVRLYTANGVVPDRLETLQQFITQLLTRDTNELYTEQLERNASDEGGSGSGLGFLTMINDYGATLAWKISHDEQDADRVSLTTMVRLPV